MSIGAGSNGSYTPPKHVSSTVQGSFTRSESSGLSTGLNSLSSFSGESHGPEINYARDPKTGNASERISENPSKGSASEKGNKFSIC